MSTALLTIVLVNYNSGEWVERCLRSFSHLSNWSPRRSDWRVVMVDNASTDGSTELIEQAYPWVEIIRLPENRGFSAGNNVALATVTTEFAMLLNTDTEFLPVTNLEEFIEKNFADPKVGIVSPRVELPDGSLDHASHRGFPTLWNSAMYFSGLAQRFPTTKFFTGYTLGWQDSTTAHEIEACTGAAMIVRTSAMKTVGLLDEAFFMYAEDIDWCYRFHQAGWKIWYDPSVVVLHHKHKSGKAKVGSSEVKLRTTAAFYDTMKQYFRKHHGQTPALVLLGAFAMIDLLKYRKLSQERNRDVHK
jgi:N-acetylglucosaminyl-diphospho-decaprenol L-rhamnosyltransferase